MGLEVQRLGLIDYEVCRALQKKAQEELISGQARNLLILCRHHPVVTLGRLTKPEHAGEAREALVGSGVPVVEIERGGSITYHGPEQIVVYPIIDLTNFKRDVSWYMRHLEEVIVETLSHFGINGNRIEGKTGVWVSNEVTASPAKIAFIGIRISRWCTMHGFSINVQACAEQFRRFNPCGLGNIEITSIEELTGAAVSINVLEDYIESAFKNVFQFDPCIR